MTTWPSGCVQAFPQFSFCYSLQLQVISRNLFLNHFLAMHLPAPEQNPTVLQQWNIFSFVTNRQWHFSKVNSNQTIFTISSTMTELSLVISKVTVQEMHGFEKCHSRTMTWKRSTPSECVWLFFFSSGSANSWFSFFSQKIVVPTVHNVSSHTANILQSAVSSMTKMYPF